ncbi:FtsW/RodA/SpoVE family cell cycle protein [Herbivorax sp. ANBcel31]|uniref:FtsW/RodA/SpoVE family cell cycle protein n=1 Tax=Herbivorax sp. ANBcel31 TaxID=3069754 RepID=UPI0027B3ECEF|nr:FtsW/RodA/SpoVE family cell cycle protein [Herbivorax sp. ANBcel31]MDQ2085277.1 FtsW/RodA/SpoVE family cell cycle protein [Herbivorax sp. ANBcel31]
MYSLPDKTKKNKFEFDYLLFFSVILLSVFGIIILSSATTTMSSGTRMVMVQIISMFLGIGICLAINFFDYTTFKILSGFLYIIGIALLIAVLIIGEGYETSGSDRWLVIPVINMSFQPSEIAKIFFILLVSKHFEKLANEVDKMTIIKIAIFTLIPILLILRQPDGGTAMTFLVILFVIAFVHGIPFKYIFAIITAAVAAFPIAWMFILKGYQKDRLLSFIDPSSDIQGAAYQVNRAEMTVGSGRIWGQGLFSGTQSQSEFGVPVRESDFIFTVIGEELGFIGSALLISLIMFILFRCIYVALKSKDMYGSYVTIGLTAMLSFNFIQNIGMNIGILPVTGVPLPFVSAGGSAMVTYYIAIGIIMSVSRRKNNNMFKTTGL